MALYNRTEFGRENLRAHVLKILGTGWQRERRALHLGCAFFLFEFCFLINKMAKDVEGLSQFFKKFNSLKKALYSHNEKCPEILFIYIMMLITVYHCATDKNKFCSEFFSPITFGFSAPSKMIESTILSFLFLF